MGEAEDGAPPPPPPAGGGGGGGGGAFASEKAISRSRNKPKEEVLEVKCESSGKTRRFAPGTEAGFAVSVINQKLLHQYQSDLQINSNSSSKTPPPPPLAVHIEAFKQGSDDDDDADVDEEEPITFGPNSLLLNYGPRWILHTVLSHPLPSPPPSSGVADKDGIPIPPPVVINKPVPPPVHDCESSAPTKVTKPAISLVYIGKIILAFILLFLLGAIFTLALDNLPLLISFISSSL